MKNQRRQKVEETGVVHKYCLISFTTFAMQIIYTLHDGSDGKASVCNAGDLGLIPGLGRSPGEGNGSPLQYSCLENPMDGGACLAAVHGVAKSRTRLSDFTFTFMIASSQFMKGIKGTNFLSFFFFFFFSENAFPSILPCEKFHLTSHKVSHHGS